MRTILSASSQRKLNLIDYLFVFKHKRMKDIQKDLGYNTITLWKDISEINEMIHPCGIIQTENSEFFLFFSKKYEYRIHLFLFYTKLLRIFFAAQINYSIFPLFRSPLS